MTDGSVAQLAGYVPPESGQTAAPRPNAAQIAQFEQLAQYDVPDSPTVQPEIFSPLLNHAAQVSDQVRTALESYPQIDARVFGEVSPAVRASVEMEQQMVAHTLALMSFTYMTKMAELTQSSMKTLFQQQG